MAEITLECPHCRKSVKSGEEYAGKETTCPACGVAIAIPVSAAPEAAAAPAASCAPILGRLLAGALDWLIVVVIAWALSYGWVGRLRPGPERPEMILFAVVLVFASWLYFAIPESLSRQATHGKRRFHILVADINGKRISFLRATFRHLVKAACVLPLLLAVWVTAVSGRQNPIPAVVSLLTVVILLADLLAAALTPKRQALHDIVARTLVLTAGLVPERDATTAKLADEGSRVASMVLAVISCVVGTMGWMFFAGSFQSFGGGEHDINRIVLVVLSFLFCIIGLALAFFAKLARRQTRIPFYVALGTNLALLLAFAIRWLCTR